MISGTDSQQQPLDPAVCWQAMYSRDRRFDGRFFAAATSTGLYCRSICPVPFAKPKHIILFSCAAAAEAGGFKPCRRCHPQAAPGTPAWLGTSAVVSRALRLIWDGALNETGVDQLAERVGIGARHLRRLFVQHLGASPIQIAGTQRVHFARKLIDETDLPMTQIALSAGFMSIREFNHAFKAATGQPPGELRRSRDRIEAAATQPKGLVIRLPYRPPFNWAALIQFLEDRATPGVELVTNHSYARTIRAGGSTGTLTVRLDAAEARLIVCIELPEYQMLMRVVERVKAIFDLRADPMHVANALSGNSRMGSLVQLRPGLRVPGVWDGFELAVKAILGEGLISKCSKTVMRKLVQRFGKPAETPVQGLTHLFPLPGALANADLAAVPGLRADQAMAIRTLAGLVDKGHLTFEASATLDNTVSHLLGIPGITSTAAEYIAMRAFGEPDAFPVDAASVSRFLAPDREISGDGADSRAPESWRPWRAYAAMHLWAMDRFADESTAAGGGLG